MCVCVYVYLLAVTFLHILRLLSLTIFPSPHFTSSHLNNIKAEKMYMYLYLWNKYKKQLNKFRILLLISCNMIGQQEVNK